MSKWVIIQDARELPCYKNVNARLAYLHAAMGCDIGTYVYTTSLRRMASEVGITLDALRHALKVLQRDCLIELLTAPQTAPQGAPQRAPQGAPQKAPQLTCIKINKLETASRTASTTANTTANTTESTTASTNGIKNRITKDPSKPFTLTNARECAGRLRRTAEDRLGLAEADAAAMVNDFLDRQRLKKHSWDDEGDMAAHFIAFAEKRLPRPRLTANRGKSDHDARLAERQRVEEEASQMSAQERAREELARMRGWLADYEREGMSREAADLRAAIAEKEAAL